MALHDVSPAHLMGNMTYTEKNDNATMYDDWENNKFKEMRRQVFRRYLKSQKRQKSTTQISLPSKGSSSTTAANGPRTTSHAVVQQNLAIAPPVPILNIGLEYILGQIGANATERGNESISEPPKNAKVAIPRAIVPRTSRHMTLNKRVDGPIQCGLGKPCADGSCCNSVSRGCCSEENVLIARRTESVASNPTTANQPLRSLVSRIATQKPCVVLIL